MRKTVKFAVASSVALFAALVAMTLKEKKTS